MGINTIIMYAILLVAAVGAIVGWSNSKKGATWGQPLTIVCAIIAICMGLFLAYRNSTGSAATSAAMARENAYRTAKVTVAANKLNETFSGKKVYVIVDPNVNLTTDIEVQTWKKLMNLTDDNFLAPEQPKMPAGPDPNMEMTAPMDEWFNVAMFDKLIKGKKPDLIIFTTCLPKGKLASKGKFVSPELKDTKIALVTSNLINAQGFIAVGTAVFAITSSPKAVYDDKPAPKATQEAFDKRYMIIDKSNLKEIMVDNAGIFGIM